MLGGVHVESELGLAGHSDADAALHALTDAILGALGAGDIGTQFPDTDPQYKDADSAEFVRSAITMVRQQNMRVENADLTILAEKPKLSGAKDAMKNRIAELLEAPASRIAVKAKTNEKMGFVGRGEGIAVMATVMLIEDDSNE